jgi:predicted acylesterase/phospholipase RssA
MRADVERGALVTDARIAEPHVAVALSGGGHRAALFGLGALLYLVDAGKGREIGCVSSVSGGSMTNGWVALTTDLHTVTGAQLRADVRPLVRACSTTGTVWSSPLTVAYLASMVAVLAAATYLCFPLGGAWPFLVWAIALLVVGWLAQRRGWVAERGFERALYRGARLDAINSGVDHVICSADLQTAEAVFFAGRFLHSYRLGWGRPGDLRLARAVQSSAALPGAFHPRRLGTAGLGFERPAAVRRMLLADGGVYDNMATEWPVRLAERVGEGTPPSPAPHVCDELIVVNSSAAQGVRPRRSVDVPLLGELTELLAVKDVLYDQTTAVRRRWLNLRFHVAREPDCRLPGVAPLAGTTVQIDRSPLALPRQFDRGGDDYGRRARAAISHLAVVPDEEWERDALASRSVKTALSKIPPHTTARLLRHAYALTMANAHVLLGYELLPIPALAELEELTR